MKKKLLVFAILTAIFTPKVRAENGPSDEGSYIVFYSEEGPEVPIYNSFGAENQELEGVSYDAASNTLTLTNFTGNYYIETNMMGDDFKLKLVGENSFSAINVWGDGYGGSLNIIGDGSLTINESKEEPRAIGLLAEGSNAVLTIENTATVKLYAGEEVIDIMSTKIGDTSKAIALKNGQDISSNIEKKNYEHVEYVKGIYFDTELHNDYTIYTKDGKNYGLSEQGGKFCITSSPIVYDDVTGYYFVDRTVNLDPDNPWNYNIEFDTMEDVLAAGFVATEENVTTTSVKGMEAMYMAYKDANNKKYVVNEDHYNDEVTYTIYEITERTMMLSDGNQYNIWNLNTDVQYEDLTESMVTENDLFNYIVNLKELTIEAGEAQVPVEQVEAPATEEKQEEKEEKPAVKVEPVENTEEDKAAVEAVTDIINSIVALDEGTVEGVSEELANKIREKVENGETILVELSTQKVEETAIEKDVEKIKEKVPENAKVAAFYDINVLVKTDSENLGNVTALKEKIQIALPIPLGLPAVPAGHTRTFKVMRLHGDEVKELAGTVSGDNVLTETDLFSTYALTYEDTKNTSNPKTGDTIAISVILFAVSVIGIATIVKMNKNK